MKTILIAGLGNPGRKYEKTRHNAGFMFVDYFHGELGKDFDFSHWKFMKKLDAEISVGTHEELKIILLKPQIFMNLSGSAVSAAMKYFKMKPENIFVAQDEIDLPLGNCKISSNRSSAGHQGVQNIIDVLGTKNFARLRIGIDNRKGKKIATEKYVLGRFKDSEMKKLQKNLAESTAELIKIIL